MSWLRFRLHFQPARKINHVYIIQLKKKEKSWLRVSCPLLSMGAPATGKNNSIARLALWQKRLQPLFCAGVLLALEEGAGSDEAKLLPISNPPGSPTPATWRWTLLTSKGIGPFQISQILNLFRVQMSHILNLSLSIARKPSSVGWSQTKGLYLDHWAKHLFHPWCKLKAFTVPYIYVNRITPPNMTSGKETNKQKT